MIKKLSSIFLLSACAFTLQAASLSADETIENAAVGIRAESVEARQDQLQSRAKMIATAEAQEASKPAAKLNAKTLMAAKMMAPAAVAKSMYYTSHPSAYQYPISVSYFGETVGLMDGSIWNISSFDAYKTKGWYTTDLVVITPNHSWLSLYSFCLTNQTTGETASANLSVGPTVPGYGLYTNWITGIDYTFNIIYLQDGSRWNMSSFDSSTVYQWVVGDVVIIGVNDGFLSSTKPNILINVATLTFAAGQSSF